MSRRPLSPKRLDRAAEKLLALAIARPGLRPPMAAFVEKLLLLQQAKGRDVRAALETCRQILNTSVPSV